jgi:DNA-directed RNA polymerase subunit L
LFAFDAILYILYIIYYFDHSTPPKKLIVDYLNTNGIIILVIYILMSKKIDIAVGNVNKVLRDVLIDSELTFDMIGADVNEVIGNTLRRVCYDDVPTYAFASECIEIEFNNTIYNNDAMKVRLSSLPLYNLSPPLHFLHPKYWQSIDYSDPKREKHPDEQLIELYVNAHNNTPENMNVQTTEATVFIDGEQVEMYNKNDPILLIDLRPNESFKCRMKAVLGVGERNNIWAACGEAHSFADDNNENKVTYHCETSGQMDEFEVLVKSCKLLQTKLDAIKSVLENKVSQKEIVPAKSINFELVGEDHTIGQLMCNAWQNNPKIYFAGVAKPDHLVRMVRFKVTCEDEQASPLPAMFESIDYLVEVFQHLEKQFTKLLGSKPTESKKVTVKGSK